MAGGRSGGEGDAASVRRCSEEPGGADGGRGASGGGGAEVEIEGEVGEAGEAWVGAFFRARRARIDPEGKRAEYLRRLELLMGKIDAMLDGHGARKGELRAMDVMIRAVRASYVMVQDANVEALERAYKELEGEAGGESGPGYEVEEGSPG